MSSKDRVDERFNHHSLQDSHSIIKYLQAVTAGFESGRILLCAGKEELILRPSGLLDLDVGARRKNGRVRIELRISWKDGKDEDVTTAPLFIRPAAAEADGEEV
jgi:amphi-Trp domain-containing protein